MEKQCRISCYGYGYYHGIVVLLQVTSLSEFCCPFIFQLIAGVFLHNNCQVVHNSTRAIFGLYVVSLLSANAN